MAKLADGQRLIAGDLLLAMPDCPFPRARVLAWPRARHARRLAARVNDAAQRQALAQLFPGEGELEERLAKAYAATEDDNHGFERAPSSSA